MTSTELYTTMAGQAREVTEKSVEAFKQGTKTFADRAAAATQLPTVDLTTPVARYFDYVQQTVDRNREIATTWAEMFTSVSSSMRDTATSFTGTVKEQTDKVADLVTEQADRAEQVAKEQADKAEQVAKEQAEQAEQLEKDLIKEAKKAERDAAKKAHEEARAAYEGLTKAELSDQLAARELPKTGTVEELIERLVAADTDSE